VAGSEAAVQSDAATAVKLLRKRSVLWLAQAGAKNQKISNSGFNTYLAE
jgi:hypothetical protein